MDLQTILGILIPFVGTSLGAAMVFILKKNISDGLQKGLTGFAVGVMVAASFWSLLDIKTPRLIQFNYSSADFAA